jgi:hypothetical protein
VNRRWHGPCGGRGASAPGAGAAVVGQIPVVAIGEVGQGRWLGQHGEVGDSFEAHRGGVAHRTRTLDSGGNSAKECTGAWPKE